MKFYLSGSKAWSMALVYIVAAAPNVNANEGGRSAMLEEVVVTANRREQRAQDVSISLTSFSSEKLESMGAVDAADVAAQVPGFSYSLERRGTPVFSLRGVGFNDAAAGAQSPVGVYIDEVSLPYPIMSKGIAFDIQRVDVLKGPQGTLYGRNTTAGAVNFVPNKPSLEFEAGFIASYSRFDKTDYQGYISGGNDAVQARVAVREITQREGWQNNQIFPETTNGTEDKLFARTLVNWDVSELVSLSFGATYWNDKSDAQMPQNFVRLPSGEAQIPGFSSSQAAQDHPTIVEEDARLTAFHPNRSYGSVQQRGREYGLDQEFHAAWTKLKFDFHDSASLGLTVALQDYTDGSVFNTDGLAVEIVEQIVDISTKSGSVELRLSGNVSEPLINWDAGVYHAFDSVDESYVFGLRDGSGGNAGTVFREGEIITDQEQTANAVFAQADWQVLSQLKLTLGARYTEYERDFEGCSKDSGDGGLSTVFTGLQLLESGNPLGPQPGDCITLNEEGESSLVERKLSENNTSGRFSVDWTPAEDVLVYGSAALGFKSGGFPSVAASRAEQYDAVKQERLLGYELGIKSQWLDRALQVNGALFSYDYQDKQLLSFLNDPIFGVLLKLENVDEVKNQGAELSVDYAPISNLILTTSVIYLDAKIEEFVGVNAEGDTEDFSGNQVNDAPRWEATFGANYDLPVAQFRDEDALSNLSLRFGVDVSYSEKSFAFIDNDTRFIHNERTIVNARFGIGHIDDSWSVMIWGRNITNEFYTTGFGKESEVGYRFTGMPQTYGATFTYRYQ